MGVPGLPPSSSIGTALGISYELSSSQVSSTMDSPIISSPGASKKIRVYGLFICHVTEKEIKEGIRFRFGSGPYHFNVTQAPAHMTFPNGHWEGGEAQALNFSLMGLSGKAVGTAYVTAYYRVISI